MAVVRLARTHRLFLSKSECHTLCTNHILMAEIYNKYLKEYRVKNTHISILKEAKQHRIVSRYITCSLNSQSKLNRKKNNLVLNTNISLDSLHHSNTFAKTYRKFMIRIYKLMRGNLHTIFDSN